MQHPETVKVVSGDSYKIINKEDMSKDDVLFEDKPAQSKACRGLICDIEEASRPNHSSRHLS